MKWVEVALKAVSSVSWCIRFAVSSAISKATSSDFTCDRRKRTVGRLIIGETTSEWFKPQVGWETIVRLLVLRIVTIDVTTCKTNEHGMKDRER